MTYLLCIDMLTMEPMNKGDRRIIVCVQQGNSVTAGYNESQVVGLYIRVHTTYMRTYVLLFEIRVALW